MTPANDNDNRQQQRPQWFDDLLAQYDGFIRAKCSAYDDHEDLYQDAILRVLDRWHQYRRDGNFVAWVGYHIKSVRPEQARRAKRGEKYPHYIAADTREPTQDYRAEISIALGRLNEAERNTIVAVASGYTLEEAGNMMGVTKQRAFQIVQSGRAWLAANDNDPARKVA